MFAPAEAELESHRAAGRRENGIDPREKMQPYPIEAHANVRAIASSKIREVANAGLGKRDVLPFWFGEPDEITPEFIRSAATAALAAGDTFYTHNFGNPPLREALAAYVSRLHGPTAADNVIVTNSGMAALMLVSQALIGQGDRVVAVTPLWPKARNDSVVRLATMSPWCQAG